MVVDNRQDINNIIKKVSQSDLIEEFTKSRKGSNWRFYKFLSVEFHVYQMETTIGKSQELPAHFKTDSNNKALIKYENYDDYLCFWRCLAYHLSKPEDERNINKQMKYLFHNYYGIKLDKTYGGIQYVAYDKEYTDDALDNNEYDKKNDEIDLIEKHFNININVYTNDEPESLQIDRRSKGDYVDTLNLMRYNNHFMYITDMKQLRHNYKCRKCSKIFNNFKTCNRHEQKCDELVKHTFPGGMYKKSQSIFERILDKYMHLCKKEKFYERYNPVVENVDDTYYPHECAFDFEAMLKSIETIDKETKLQITTEHVPVSVSIFSNVPDYDNKPIFYVVINQKN